VFQSPFVTDSVFAVGYRYLPKQLIEFSQRLGVFMNLFGKPGHKAEMDANRMLLFASEFVRLWMRSPHHEDLAELFQAIGSRSLSQDLSGEAIRKKYTTLGSISRCNTNAQLRMFSAFPSGRASKSHDWHESRISVPLSLFFNAELVCRDGGHSKGAHWCFMSPVCPQSGSVL